MEYRIVELTPDNKSAVIKLLETDGLITEDVLAEGTRYWGAYSGGELIGVTGCEYQGRYALLRSALVLEKYRGNGIAAKLTETLFKAARDMGLEAVYLFSTDAGGYWTSLGFTEVPVKEVIDKLYDCCQVKLLDSFGWLPTEKTYKRPLIQKEQTAK